MVKALTIAMMASIVGAILYAIGCYVYYLISLAEAIKYGL